MLDQSENVAPLPTNEEISTIPVFKSLGDARAGLGELRGAVQSLPNPDILLDTLFLQEALASSEIENIVTTQDEAFRATSISEKVSPEAKEVARYRDAMWHGYERLKQLGGISENMLIEMYRILKQREDGYRTTPGTTLINQKTKQVVYKPPQNFQEIEQLMRELEAFINAQADDDFHPLIRMALIHHRFESIHPFPDGNGRVGRILNVLYLTHVGLLDTPILYLSRAINATKPDYYRLLQAVRTKGAWEEWVIYMLDAVTQTAQSMLSLVEDIRKLMLETKQRMREELPRVYSQDLLNNLFQYPYTRIEYLAKDVSRDWSTARRYLQQLRERDFVREVRYGRHNYYINDPLVDLLMSVSADGEELIDSNGS